MKALSLWQPWASAIAAGVKKIETRSRRTNYRGPLAIHASKKLIIPNDPEFISVLKHFGLLDQELPQGCILGWTELKGCILMTGETISSVGRVERVFGRYESGRYMWLLGDFHAFKKPIPCRGQQFLFDWEEQK